MIVKIYTFFTKAYKNKDALFVSTGAILPLFLLVFRMILWYFNIHTVFAAFFGIAGINRWLETLMFCYLPSLVAFCFLSKKNTIFFFEIYQKIPFLFRSFLSCSRLEKAFYKDWPLGYLVSMFSLILYLFLLYTDTFLVHFRIPFLYCYGSFCVFLRGPLLERPGTLFPHYEKFFEIRKDLQKEHIVNGKVVLSLSTSLIGYIVYRANSVMSEYIALQESICNNLLQLISEKISEMDNSDAKKRFEELKNKKADVFNSYKRKLFLYKASLFLFNWKIEPFVEIYKEIISFYKDLL